MIDTEGGWRNFEAVVNATREWVNWFNNRRLFETVANIPPAEAETNFYPALETENIAALLTEISLLQTWSGSNRCRNRPKSAVV